MQSKSLHERHNTGAALIIKTRDGSLSYIAADIHPMPIIKAFSYDEVIPTRSEHIMSRLIPVTFGALQLGLAGVTTYILCSAPVLNEAVLFFAH